MRRLAGMPFLYLWLDVPYLKALENRRVVLKAVVTVTAVRRDGRGEIVGVDIGASKHGTCRTESLFDVIDRGIASV